jgi:hypothetical protein
MGISLRIDQLHVDPHLTGRLLHTTLNYVRYPKLFCDLRKIARLAVIALRRTARNYFYVLYTCQSCQDFLLDAFSEIGVVRIVAEVLKRQYRDTLWN